MRLLKGYFAVNLNQSYANGTPFAVRRDNTYLCTNSKTPGRNKMLGNIFHRQGNPAQNPLRLTGVAREMPVNTIKRNIRRDPMVQPGEEIYDRARIIFGRARQNGRSRASNTF